MNLESSKTFILSGLMVLGSFVALIMGKMQVTDVITVLGIAGGLYGVRTVAEKMLNANPPNQATNGPK